MILTLAILFSLWRVTEPKDIQISYEASTNSYNPVPKELRLITVAVITRHGDRAQITRALGPKHPENENITSFWKSKLPIEKSFRFMAISASPNLLENDEEKLISNLYTGWDQSHKPYAQLTELGYTQLVAVGKELRRRYVGSFLPKKIEEATNYMYCRSTNICRTIQSLRSLLGGMYDNSNSYLFKKKEQDLKYANNKREKKNQSLSISHLNTNLTSHILPYIHTRLKMHETLFPHADGPCKSMTELRLKLYYHHLNASAISRWGSLEKRMIHLIGSTNRRIGWLTWLNILDVFTAFQAHNISFPTGFTYTDLENVTELVAWTWDVLYADTLLSSLAIGRFIGELVDDIDASVAYNTSLKSSPKSSPIGGLRKGGAETTHTGESKILKQSKSIPTPLIAPNAPPSLAHILLEKISYFFPFLLPPLPLKSNPSLKSNQTENTNFKQNTSKIDIGKPQTNEFIQPTTRLLIYSAHDSTMVPLLGAIGLYQGNWPPYASYLTLEVARLISKPVDGGNLSHGIIDELYVRAVYNDEDRIMTGCNGYLWCPYELFRTQISKTALTQSGYRNECDRTERSLKNDTIPMKRPFWTQFL